VSTYIDTNVLIAYINPKDPNHIKAKEIIENTISKVVSQIAVLELFSVYSRNMDLTDIELEALVNYILKKSSVLVKNVDWKILYEYSLSYANKLKLKTLDLLHTIAAYLLNTDTIATFDKDIAYREKQINKALGLKVYCPLLQK